MVAYSSYSAIAPIKQPIQCPPLPNLVPAFCSLVLQVGDIQHPTSRYFFEKLKLALLHRLYRGNDSPTPLRPRRPCYVRHHSAGPRLFESREASPIRHHTRNWIPSRHRKARTACFPGRYRHTCCRSISTRFGCSLC